MITSIHQQSTQSLQHHQSSQKLLLFYPQPASKLYSPQSLRDAFHPATHPRHNRRNGHNGRRRPQRWWSHQGPTPIRGLLGRPSGVRYSRQSTKRDDCSSCCRGHVNSRLWLLEHLHPSEARQRRSDLPRSLWYVLSRSQPLPYLIYCMD